MTATVLQLPSVESLTEEIRGLVFERQTLRLVGAPHDDLERNRVELVRAQQQLVHALIRRHLPSELHAA
jgi:hypothetical protein